MTKQTESLTAPKKDGNLANLSSSALLSLRETMNQAEAVEWVKRYRKKALEDGKREAWNWWRDTLEDIAKRRGQQAADELRNRMNKLKDTK
jgi:hypothetical protein